MDRNELVTIAQRLREYAGNPHHVDPMSDAFKVLIGDAANALSQAAQPQGEPVALPERSFVGDIRNPYRHTVLHDGYISGWNAYQDAMVRLGPLYAEQPAPVAVVLPERSNERDHAGDFTYEAKSWNACLDELKRLNPSL